MKSPFLVGGRVYLRPLEREDAAVVQPWVNDPEVTRSLLLYRPTSRQAEEDYIATVNANEKAVALLIVAREGDRPVGVLGLNDIDWRNRQAQFGILIGEKSEWGKGYASEATRLLVGYAFDTLNLHRIVLKVIEDHAPAVRCYRKAGFQQEGVLRDDLYKEGRYHNTLVMSVLKSEWDARRT